MSDQPTKLRNVCIHGPCFGNDPAVDPPMWELTVGAPHFRTQRDPDAGSSTEDNVHPIRTLLIDEDPTAISISPAPSSGSSVLRVPRAMSIHVIAGSRNAHYASADETLSVRLQPKLAVASATDGSLVTLDGEHPGFVHVVVEPVAPARPGDPAWPAQRAAGSDILLPPVRLLSGAIALRTKRATLPWLDRLIDGPPTADVRLDLTPRGIEVDAAVPFPGSSALLPGRFLLCPVAARSTKPAALELRLLPEQLPVQHVALWMAAWQAVTPDESGGAALPGMQLSARRSGRPPAFRWRLSVAGTGLAALPSQVEVPREDVRLILAGTGTAPPDGIAEIRSEHVHLVSLPAKERPTATLQEFDLSPAALDFVGAQGVVPANTVALVVEGRRVAEPRWAASYEARRLGKSDVDADLHVFAGRGADAIPLSHDSRRLAARLREVYGLPEPRLPGAGSDDVAARAAGAPAVLPRDDVDPARPLLYGFVPLARGWLQIPLPNVLQQNPDDDGAMLGAVGRRSASALDGFVRIAQTVQLPSISGHDERPPDAMRSLDAAWSVAVEGAAGAAGVVVLEPGPAAKMRTAAICLDEPELSCRGLLWLSSDRPDGLEALPRVGAGPGSFLDVPLTTAAAGRVGPAQFALRRLHLDLERASATRDDLELVLTWLDNASTTASAALASPSAGSATEPATSSAPTTAPPSPRAIAWLRHPILPLAAEMPMTRSAAAAVRPLESRDLAPFVVEPVVTPKGTVVVPIAWRAAAPFARLESPVGQGKAPSMTLSSTWPSPTTPARPHTENGVAFAAFGVPGAELVPAGDGGWSSMRYAYRFDLPVLDEAFATATVPPPPDGPSPAAAVTPTAGAADDRTVPPPTALDPTSLAAFWAEQQRRHQLARVVHSYAVPFGDVGAPQSTSIETLIEGAALAATSSFRVQTSSAALPYGAIDFGTLAGPASGDEALLGVSGTFAVAGDRIERLDGLPPADGDGAPQVDPRGVAAEQVALLGWSPSTWVADGFQLDNARLGVQAPPAPVGLAVLRPLRHRGTPYQLATTLRPLPIAGTALELWFKDVPLDASGTFVLTDRLGKPAETDTAFDAWMSDRLPFDGYEWRLYATGGDGRASDRLPFFGFTLEPLRLSRLRLEPASGETTRVVLLARLLLGAEGSRLHRSENLVLLELAPAAPGGPLSIRSVTPFGGQAAVFPLEQPAHGSRPARSARLSGVPGFAGGGLTLGDAVLELDVHGIPMRFAKTVAVTVSPAGGVEATWDAPASTGRPDSGRGQLRVQRVRVAVPPPGDAASPAAPRIDIDTLLEIQPMQVFKPAQVQIAAVRWQQTQSADAARRDHDGLHVLGLKLLPPATVDASPSPEDDGALALVLEGAVRGAPCVGWPEQDGTARAMLAVTLRGPQQGMPSDQPLRAVCGRVEMVVTFEGESNGMALREMHVVLEAGRPESADPDKWNGEITLTGQIARTSAIRWPHVRVEPPDADVPEPGTADRDGRRRVRGFGTEALTHTATYVLRRHRLPFGFFLYAPDLDRWAMAFAWTVLASAHHELSVGDRRLSWWSVESLSIGSPAILFEEDHVERDPLAFAARYRDDLDGVQRKRNPDMVLPGLGRMGGVLHGLLGREFRTAAKGDVAHRGRLLAVGGFVGFLDGRKDDAAARDAFSLVRLPFVVRLGDPTDDPLAPGAVTQSGVAGTTRELAWVDTTVARDVRRAVELAATPRARDEAALQAAVYAASAWSQRKLDQELQLAAAVLVEQAFVKSVDGPPNLATTPFWLSAANVLWQAFEQNARQVASDTPDPQGGLRSAVSIVSGRLLRTASPPLPASDPPVGVSALLRAAPPTTDDAPAAMAAGSAPVLLSAGDLLLEEPWPATTVEPDATSLHNGLAAAMALRAHARPRLAMVRGPHRTADGDRIAFVKIKLPRPVLAEMPRARAPQSPPVFAEPGRGYPAPPGTRGARWLAPPRQGRIAAVRDADSGIAGLGHVVTLPAHASAGRSDARALAADLVWLSEKRVPVYLPLPIPGVRAPAIPWLSTAPPRCRLPVADEVGAAIDKARAARQPTPPGDDVVGQAFLPGDASVLSVGERAGILTARRTLLLAPLEQSAPETGASHAGSAFDPVVPRFGAAAQVGPSVARQIRTPRPGRLPDNVGDAKHDRLTSASALLTQDSATFVVGPADTVRGPASGGTPAWTVLVVGAPCSDGIVTDDWDGSVRLRFEIDVSKAPPLDPAFPSPARLLGALLFPNDGASGPLGASAELLVGQQRFPFRSLRVVSGGAWPADTGLAVRRATVDVVLDLREATEASARGARREDLATILRSGAATPPVEVRLTVQPSSERVNAAPDAEVGAPLEPGRSFALARRDAAEAALPSGASRPPVTLRIPLAAVTATRGTLPLVPTTLLFCDAAYEEGLASPPAADDRVVAMLDASVPTSPQLPPYHPGVRGAVRGVLAVDRRSVSVHGTLALMADLRFEKPLTAPRLTAGVDGDLKSADLHRDIVDLAIAVVRRSGERRRLWLTSSAPPPPSPSPLPTTPLRLARVYELSLAKLREAQGDGQQVVDAGPARLEAGDVLEIILTGRPHADAPSVRLVDDGGGGETVPLRFPQTFSRTVRVVLTNEPVVEPPPALYAALTLAPNEDGQSALSLPLYAQSPLPARVDWQNLKEDLRAGLVHRSATFTWSLLRTRDELGPAATPATDAAGAGPTEPAAGQASVAADPAGGTEAEPAGTIAPPRVRVAIVKYDRNGQAHLPEHAGKMVPPRRV